MKTPSHLKQRRLGWYVQLAVPRSRQEALGCKVLTRSLQTRDYGEALKRRHKALAELQSLINDTPQASAVGSPEALLEAAKRYREAVDAGVMESVAAAVDGILSKRAKALGTNAAGHPKLPPEDASTIRRAHKVLSGAIRETLDYQREPYLKDAARRLRAQTVEDKRRRLAAFCRWFGGDRNCADVTRRDASAYVSEVIKERKLRDTDTPVSVVTMKNEVSDLRAWFTWLQASGLVDSNPFDRITELLKESTRGKEAKRRPWRPEELRAVLDGTTTDDPLWSLAVIGAYTGLRIEEIAQLRASSVDGSMLLVQEGKTAAAVRRVPIHPALAPLIARLAETSPDGFLIPGLLLGGRDNKRAVYLGKRFAYLRKKVGITDPRVVFHGFRHTAVTAMEGAGVPASTISLIVGHKRQGMTLGTYSAGVPDAVKLAAIKNLSYGKVDQHVRAKGGKVEVRVFAKPRSKAAT